MLSDAIFPSSLLLSPVLFNVPLDTARIVTWAFAAKVPDAFTKHYCPPPILVLFSLVKKVKTGSLHQIPGHTASTAPPVGILHPQVCYTVMRPCLQYLKDMLVKLLCNFLHCFFHCSLLSLPSRHESLTAGSAENLEDFRHAIFTVVPPLWLIPSPVPQILLS